MLNKHSFIHASPGRRSGFTMIEISVAAVLTLAAITLFVQLVATTVSQRRIDRLRSIATDELQNLIDSVAFDEAPTPPLDRENLELSIRRALPDGRLEVNDTPCRLAPDGRLTAIETGSNEAGPRLTARCFTISWSVGENLPRRSVSLVRLHKAEPVVSPSVFP